MDNFSLRPIAEKDIPFVADILQDARVNPTYMVPDLSRDDALKLAARIAGLCSQEDRYVRGIYCNNTLIGFLNDVGIDGSSIELGWVIAPRYWRMGYATKAVSAAIEALFGKGFRYVEAGAFSENPVSLRVMEKAGMKRLEKTEEIEYRGKTHLCIFYGRSHHDLS